MRNDCDEHRHALLTDGPRQIRLKEGGLVGEEGEKNGQVIWLHSGRELIVEQHIQSLSEQILNSGRVLRFRVRGESMSPLLKDGDVIDVERVPPGQLYVGDIVLFRSREGVLLVHRCVKRRAASGQIWVTTKGDAGRGLDRPITVDQILGRVIRIHRGGRIRVEVGIWSRLINYTLAKGSLYRSWLIRIRQKVQGRFSQMVRATREIRRKEQRDH